MTERTVRRFHDRLTQTDFHVTTDDGQVFRVVGLHHSSEHGEHGAFLTPAGAHLLARALDRAADRASKEQVQQTRSTVRRELRRALSKLTPEQLDMAAGLARKRRGREVQVQLDVHVPVPRKLPAGMTLERSRRGREAGGRLTSELESALVPPAPRKRRRTRS